MHKPGKDAFPFHSAFSGPSQQPRKDICGEEGWVPLRVCRYFDLILEQRTEAQGQKHNPFLFPSLPPFLLECLSLPKAYRNTQGEDGQDPLPP